MTIDDDTTLQFESTSNLASHLVETKINGKEVILQVRILAPLRSSWKGSNTTRENTNNTTKIDSTSSFCHWFID